MEKQAVKQILLDQREEIKKIFDVKIIEREIEEKVRASNSFFELIINNF